MSLSRVLNLVLVGISVWNQYHGRQLDAQCDLLFVICMELMSMRDEK